MPHSSQENTHVANSKPFVWGSRVGAVSSERDITEITQLSQKIEKQTRGWNSRNRIPKIATSISNVIIESKS